MPEAPIFIGLDAGWAPQPTTVVSMRETPVLAENTTLAAPPTISHCIDWAALATEYHLSGQAVLSAHPHCVQSQSELLCELGPSIISRTQSDQECAAWTCSTWTPSCPVKEENETCSLHFTQPNHPVAHNQIPAAEEVWKCMYSKS
jgi:hypothetical protein